MFERPVAHGQRGMYAVEEGRHLGQAQAFRVMFWELQASTTTSRLIVSLRSFDDCKPPGFDSAPNQSLMGSWKLSRTACLLVKKSNSQQGIQLGHVPTVHSSRLKSRAYERSCWIAATSMQLPKQTTRKRPASLGACTNVRRTNVDVHPCYAPHGHMDSVRTVSMTKLVVTVVAVPSLL